MKQWSLPVRRSTFLWWSGLALIALFGLIVSAAIFFMAGCEVDCGDQGGRFMFGLVVASTPIAAVGGLLTWLAGRAGNPAGAPRLLRRTLPAAVGLGLVVAAIGLGLLGLAAFVEALHQFEGWLTGRGLSGPLSDPEYMRDQARDTALFMSFVGLVCLASAIVAITPVVALLRQQPLPALFQPMLLALAWLALTAAVLGVAGAGARLAERAGSLQPGEVILTLGLPALPAALAAGAFLTATELRRQKPTALR